MYLNSFHNLSASSAWNGEDRLVNLLGGLDPAVVFDVGANVGDWSLGLLAASPGSRVHAFEPVPTTADAFQRRVGDRATLVRSALGSSPGAAILYVPFGTTSVLASAVVAGDGQPIECPVSRGDEYCRDHGIEQIDFLKVDVEGWELEALRGFGAML